MKTPYPRDLSYEPMLEIALNPERIMDDMTDEDKQELFEVYQFEIMDGVVRSLGWEEIVRKCYICLIPKSDESYEDWSRKNLKDEKTVKSYKPGSVSDDAFMRYVGIAAQEWYEIHKEGAENA